MSGGNGPPRPGQESDLGERLQRLQAQVDRKNQARSGPGSSRADGSAMGQAMRLSSEFIGGVVVGGGLGWGFDAMAGTKPWGLLVFLLLGFATGIYNVMRVSGFIGPNAKPPNGKNGPEGP